MALFQLASGLKLPRSEAGLGGAPQIVPWSLTFDPLLMSFICLAILVVRPCFHRLTCILKVEHVLTLSLHDVLLACRHDLSYDWVHPSFQSLSVVPKCCAYDLMIFYKLSTSMPQWSTAAKGCVWLDHPLSWVCLCHFDHIDVALGDVVHAVEHFAVNGRASWSLCRFCVFFEVA